MSDLLDFFIDLISIVLHFIYIILNLIFRTLGFASLQLSAEPKEGESKYSIRRILTAFLPFTLICSILGLCIWFFIWQPLSSGYRIAMTNEQVKNLASKIKEEGNIDPNYLLSIDAFDTWGSKIRITMNKKMYQNYLVVTSFGPDRSVNTGDDIISSIRMIQEPNHIKKNLIKKAKGIFSDIINKNKISDKKEQ